MSITLAEKPPASPESGLVESLRQGARQARRSGRSLRLAGLQARLEAMRLVPPPTDPKKALGHAAEAARLAREIRAAGGGDGPGPAQATDVGGAAQAAQATDAESAAQAAQATDAESAAQAAQVTDAESAAQAARAVIARMRRSVKPGGREDRLMAELDTGPAAAAGGGGALDLMV
jgi:hypothetical protein